MLRLLLIEDDDGDANLVVRELQRGGHAVEWKRVDTAEGLEQALGTQSWDLITCDWVMPRFGALAALEILRQRAIDTPILIVTGEVGEEVAVAGMRAGARDVVSKSRLTRLGPAVDRELQEAQMRLASKRAEQALEESERHFRSLIEKALDLVAIVERNGAIRYASPSHEETTGYEPEELVGENAFDFVHPDDRDAVKNRFLAGLETEPLKGSTIYRFRRKDGSWSVVEGVARDLTDDPLVRGVLVNSRDISERKRAELAAQVRSRLVDAVFDHTLSCLVLLDPRFNFVRVNEAYARACRRGIEEFAGRNHFDLYPSDARQIFEQVVATKQPFEVRARPFSFPDQPERGVTYWDWTLVPLLDEQGEVEYLLFALHDVTEHIGAAERLRANEERLQEHANELERRVRERTAQYEALNRELEAFAYSVSHDLRAPLRAIVGFCQALVEDYGASLPDEGRTLLELIRSSADRMGRLIRDLLSLSRIDRQDMSPGPVHLSALAQEIAGELRAAEPARQVEFVIAPDVVAVGDAGLLRIALENLLGNAWKYTSKHPTAHIEFGRRQGEGGASVYFVRDDGAGFDMKQAEHLFTAFHRLHAQSEFEGTGIGLATVQRVIHRHRGRIWAEGAVERGATFSFTLGT